MTVRGGEAMAAKRTAAQGVRRRNATEREQGPGRERKPRVGKEEGPPLSRGRLRVSDGLLS